MPQAARTQQCVELAKAMLEVARLFSRACFPGAGERFGARADDLILHAALFIGQADGRPMNASKLAEYAGLPRPPVIRKLKALERNGAVVRQDGGFALKAGAVDSAAIEAAGEAAGRVLDRLARRGKVAGTA